MKGVIFNLLEEAVSRDFGCAVWDALLDASGASGAYTSLGSYSDSEIASLVAAASEKLAISQSETLRWFGRRAMPLLKDKYSTLFHGQTSSRGFVTSVNAIIHPEVRKLYPDARCPFFGFSGELNGELVIHYDSPRRMCHLAQGFIEGAAELYEDKVSVTHRSCVHLGEQSCLLAVTWH